MSETNKQNNKNTNNCRYSSEKIENDIKKNMIKYQLYTQIKNIIDDDNIEKSFLLSSGITTIKINVENDIENENLKDLYENIENIIICKVEKKDYKEYEYYIFNCCNDITSIDIINDLSQYILDIHTLDTPTGLK